MGVNRQPVPAGSSCLRRGQISNQSRQPGLRVGVQDDQREHEADRAAERVLSGGFAGGLGEASPMVYRKCAACAVEDELIVRRQEEEEEEALQLKTSTDGQQAPGADSAAAAVSRGGRALPEALRSYFEPRFATDFSRVRVHTHDAAANAARSINARAFTLGNDIGFAPGEFSPGSYAGRKLIAHELAHTVQQAHEPAGSTVRREAGSGESGTGGSRFPLTRSSPVPDPAGGGETAFEEVVRRPPTEEGGELVGEVERREFVPAEGETPREEIHSGRVRVRFNPATCRVTIPYRLAFRQQGTATAPFCQGPPAPGTAVQPLPDARFNELKRNYIEAINNGLNGWYSARLENCEHDCAGRNIPIRVEVEENDSSPDRTINVVNRAGRGNASTICAPDYSTGFAVHEGGHQVLGHGDEYPERDPSLRRRMPEWARSERVRPGDWSRMHAATSFGRFALFHRRHFRFVPAFLDAALLDCRASLVELNRPVVPDFRFGFGVGYAHVGGSGLYAGGGFDVGFPLDRERRWRALLGAHGRMLSRMDDQTTLSWMVGARLGLERTFSPSAGGAQLGGFLEVGGGSFQPTLPEEYRSERFGAAYGELGLTAGYSTSVTSDTSFFVGAELAGGMTLRGRGRVGEPGAEADESDSEQVRWLRAGVRAGLAF